MILEFLFASFAAFTWACMPTAPVSTTTVATTTTTTAASTTTAQPCCSWPFETSAVNSISPATDTYCQTGPYSIQCQNLSGGNGSYVTLLYNSSMATEVIVTNQIITAPIQVNIYNITCDTSQQLWYINNGSTVQYYSLFMCAVYNGTTWRYV